MRVNNNNYRPNRRTRRTEGFISADRFGTLDGDIGTELVPEEPCECCGDTPCTCGGEGECTCGKCEDTGNNCFAKLLTETYKLLFNLQTVHWNSIGTDFYCLHEELDNHIEYTRGIIDELAEMKLEFDPCIQNPIDLIKTICDNDVQDLACGFEKDEGFAVVQACEKDYIAALNACYDEMPHDIQSTMDEWIRWYKVNADYKINRQQMRK